MIVCKNIYLFINMILRFFLTLVTDFRKQLLPLNGINNIVNKTIYFLKKN